MSWQVARGLGMAAVLVVLSGSAFVRPAWGQTYGSLLFGGQTGTMGGAGVAAGNDAAMHLLNPAGLAQLSNTRLSLSGSLYALSYAKVPHFFGDSEQVTTPLGDTRIDTLEQSSSKILAMPTVAAILFGLGPEAGQSGHIVVGGAVLIPFNQSFFVEGTARGVSDLTAKHSLVYAHEASQIYVGPTFGMQLGARLNVGASVFLVYQPFTNSLQSDYLQQTASRLVYESSSISASGKGRSFELVAVLGAQLRLSDDLSLGLALATPSVHLGGSFKGTGESKSFSNAQAVNQVITSSIEGEPELNLPLRVTFGAAYRFLSRFAVAADFSLFVQRELSQRLQTSDTTQTVAPGQDPKIETSSSTTGVRARRISYQFNVGLEGRITKNWLARCGFFWESRAENDFEQPLTGAEVFSFRGTRLGGTLGVASTSGAIESAYGLGFAYSDARTAAFSFGTLEPREVDATRLDIFVFISGGFDLTEIKETVGEFNKRKLR